MAAAFRPVNLNLIPQTIAEDATTLSRAMPVHDAAAVPTRAPFASTAAAAAGQKPLPATSFSQPARVPSDRPGRHRRAASQHSVKSSIDVDMDESDADGPTPDDAAGSDEDSVNADSSKSGKKSQRFYCTDFPPCNLSFTRSEHLARHIRKHTGERPFQCHCSRRFSRLDNLRQHAQTVHVNEDIPIDSLASTGSRFQRQIRTDRVRQAGSRARASTGGSAGGPPRGHAKSLSTSSIASISSITSSAYGGPTQDVHRRPPPLVMATTDPRSRIPVELYRSGPDSPYPYRQPTPGDFSTPTSATFSTAQSSPRWGSGMASPPSSHSRFQSLYSTGHRTPSRRLSVPSSVNPFQSASGHQQQNQLLQVQHPQQQHQPPPTRSPLGLGLLNSSRTTVPAPATTNSVTSPASSTASVGWPGRRDANWGVSEEALRRRTWHPDCRPYSGHQTHFPHLNAVGSQSLRPSLPPPVATSVGSKSTLRLPGIESFDPVLCRNPSPMVVDSEQPPPPFLRSAYQPAEAMLQDERRNLNIYDASLQRGLTRLDIGHKTPPFDSAGAWASEVKKAVQARAERVRQHPSNVRFEDQLLPRHSGPPPAPVARLLHQLPSQTMPAATRRHGWYQGPPPQPPPPPPPPPPSHVGPGPQAPHDPRAHVDRLVHPNLHGFSGFPSREPPQPPVTQRSPTSADSLRRLETLLAVATSEGLTATAC